MAGSSLWAGFQSFANADKQIALALLRLDGGIGSDFAFNSVL